MSRSVAVCVGRHEDRADWLSHQRSPHRHTIPIRSRAPCPPTFTFWPSSSPAGSTATSSAFSTTSARRTASSKRNSASKVRRACVVLPPPRGVTLATQSDPSPSSRFARSEYLVVRASADFTRGNQPTGRLKGVRAPDSATLVRLHSSVSNNSDQFAGLDVFRPRVSARSFVTDPQTETRPPSHCRWLQFDLVLH